MDHSVPALNFSAYIRGTGLCRGTVGVDEGLVRLEPTPFGSDGGREPTPFACITRVDQIRYFSELVFKQIVRKQSLI